MKTFELKGTARPELGKKAAKSVRSNESIPCVLYGGKETAHFQVEAADVRKLIYSPEIFVVALDIDGKKVNSILKEIQFHPVKDTILHIDFLEIFEDKPIIMEVPVRLTGLAEGVKQGGKLSQEMRKLKVRALYKNIPERLEIAVDNLGLGKTIQVGALSFDNLTILNNVINVVAAVKLTRAARGAMAKSGK
ncbi:MAG: 50S ribosomal protein L25/general stress protein Ctc [Prevotellaceae bacterium]|jgi:large subunit ribosomal protein L25|nr:50S ribosomal protein L25/general stress protein Ctc [Prevotellaceae bacterium]